MATISQSVRNIFGGVSEAPAVQQDGSTFTDLTNAFAAWGRRLGRRPVSQHVQVVSSNSNFVHEWGDYTIIVSDGGVVRVFDRYFGDELTVVNNVTWGYLADGWGLKAITVGETAYVLNPTVTVTSNAAVPTSPPFRALVTVTAGDFETTYNIVLDGGTPFAVTTPDAATAGAKGLIATNVIASNFEASINASSNYAVTRYGSTLCIRRKDGADFTVTTNDGLGDQGLKLVKDTARTFADLPPAADALTLVKILGDNGTDLDNYYVQYVSDTTGWKECTAPGQAYVINGITLPVQITRNPTTGVVTVDQAPWAVRAAGDAVTNPFPSFVGHAISDLFVYEGRLGFVSGSRVTLSEAGTLTNFFRTSAAQILASDPIDVDGAISGASNFAHALPWRGAVYLFSERAQFVLQGGRDGLTAESISISKASDYAMDTLVRPVVVGQRIFFLANVSGSRRLMDYHMQRYVDVPEAVDVSAFTPTFITGQPKVLAGDEALGVLFVVTDTGIYCYSFRDTDAGRVQSAWYLWSFTGEIMGLAMQGSVVDMVLHYPTSGIDCFEQIDLNDTSEIVVDRRIAGGVTASFDGTNTTFTIPFSVALDNSEGALIAVTEEGVPLTFLSRPAANQAVIAGNFASTVVFFGVVNMLVVRFPTLYVRDQNGAADDRGRLQLRFVTLNLQDTAAVDVTVSITGRADVVYYVNNAAPKDTVLPVPVMGRNTEVGVMLSTVYPGPVFLTSYSWEGTEHSRTPRR